MSIASMPTGPLEAALAALAKRGNPFRQQFARNSDDPVCALYHVSHLFEPERLIVRELVEQYRGTPDRPTSVLPLLGARGAGKTHLLHCLKHQPGIAPQLFVTPGAFRLDASAHDSSFLEYVLYQLISTLLSGGAQRGQRPLVYVGERLTRQVLLEATTDPEATFPGEMSSASGGWRSLGRFMGGSAPASSHTLARLAELLRESPAPVSSLLQEGDVSHEQALALASRRLERREARDLVGDFRKRMLRGCLVASLLGQEGELAAFLTDGFADVPFLVKPTRAQLTLSLLQAITQLIVGSGIPIAIAFDQLEELVYGATDSEIGRAGDAFFGGIVHLMSQAPGLCVLLFVEQGLWNRIVPPLPSHILDRLHEPIHLPNHGAVRTVRLNTPTAAQLTDVVGCRVRRTLGDFPAADQLPSSFPFDAGFLEQLAQRETVLRLMLQGCCNRLDQIFAGGGQRAPTPSDTTASSAETRAPSQSTPARADRSATDDYRELWHHEVRSATRKLQPVSALAGAAGELHAALARWLHLCQTLGVEQEEWRMHAVRDRLEVGAHPHYGVLTVVDWMNGVGASRRVGVGLWLGRGVGKPRDLDAKLAVFRANPTPIDHLILLRPADDARLSGRSQTAWESARAAGQSVRLEAVEFESFARLFAFPRWRQQLHDIHQGAALPDEVYVFLAEQTESIMLRLGLPTGVGVAAA